MAEPIVYLDRSKVAAGRLAELKAAIARLAAFIEDSEPQLMAYNVYFDDDGATMTVVHVHPDAASLDRHLKVVAAKLPAFAGLLEMEGIEIFGRPSEQALSQLHAKAQLLGTGTVVVHDRHAGFLRS